MFLGPTPGSFDLSKLSFKSTVEVTGEFLADLPSVPDGETEAQTEDRTCQNSHNRCCDLLTLKSGLCIRFVR